MKTIIELGVGVLIALTIYNVLHHFLVTLPNQRHQQTVKQVVDQEVRAMLQQFQVTTGPLKLGELDHSEVLDGVWGRGIMVFEYRCALENNPGEEETTQLLASTLEKQARSDGYVTPSGRSRLLVTDCWINQSQLSFDVADLANRATQEYVTDLHRLDN
ncbi:hypothetical protein M3M39_03945 [Fructilactobacillus hinvesii]|uniref:Uncharacterized protein n=1 Tax=Fructilactobacillus hinvesii TaxID=2940300 RepID=A0ABY5BRR3_9LACO|nr:hypothetical protein [Fructilactobacillus hinvesii]USS87281.1 hypothetical protein M3M39_03945 [Fructilactobacillus hinvesii]